MFNEEGVEDNSCKRIAMSTTLPWVCLHCYFGEGRFQGI